MIIMPMPVGNPEPDRCPKCERIEDIKMVCRKCGYEYPDEPERWYQSNWFFILTLIAATPILLWLFFTVLHWLVSETSLQSVLKSQWEWFRGIRVFE